MSECIKSGTNRLQGYNIKVICHTPWVMEVCFSIAVTTNVHFVVLFLSLSILHIEEHLDTNVYNSKT